jgi:hypothetical protein
MGVRKLRLRMIPQHVQRRRRQICAQRDTLRRQLADIRDCRVTPGPLGPAEVEQQFMRFLDDLNDELTHLDWLIDCVRMIDTA